MREVSSEAFCGPPATKHSERATVLPDATHSKQYLDLLPSALFLWLPKKSFRSSKGLHWRRIPGPREALAFPRSGVLAS